MFLFLFFLRCRQINNKSCSHFFSFVFLFQFCLLKQKYILIACIQLASYKDIKVYTYIANIHLYNRLYTGSLHQYHIQRYPGYVWPCSGLDILFSTSYSGAVPDCCVFLSLLRHFSCLRVITQLISGRAISAQPLLVAIGDCALGDFCFSTP